MKDCKQVSAPQPIFNENLRRKPFNSTKYRQAIGNLLFLPIWTGSDVLFAGMNASGKASNPNHEYWEKFKCIIKYF
jgi:hypothetical protein